TAFRHHLADQRDRLRELALVAFVGALVGSGLLLLTSEDAFDFLAPWLVLLACGLFAAQPYLARWLAASGAAPAGRSHRVLRDGGVFGASIYGAYFGAGLGVVLLAVLGITVPARLTELNAV